MNTSQEHCASIPSGSSATPAALMFCVGVVGNGVAASILWCSRPDSKRSVFFTLVCALTATDLLSTLLSSPVVLTAYIRNSTLRQLGGDTLCLYFTCCMLFFGAATMGILFAMAFERCLSLSHPYAYRRLVRRAGAVGALAGVYLLSLLASLMPVVSFGRSRMYAPCTWCYIEMRHDSGYSVLYALALSALIVAVLACNASVMLSLRAMRSRMLPAPDACQRCHQQQQQPPPPPPRTPSTRRKLSLHRRLKRARGVEVDNLVLLVVMTIIFLICSLPLTVSAFINAIDPKNSNFGRDLTGLRFASFNPILDPWIFIIFRRSVFERLRSVLCYCLALLRHKREAGVAVSRRDSEPPSGSAGDPASDRRLPPRRADSGASNCACDATDAAVSAAAAAASDRRPCQPDPVAGARGYAGAASNPAFDRDLGTGRADSAPGDRDERPGVAGEPASSGEDPGRAANRRPRRRPADSGGGGEGAADDARGPAGATGGAAGPAASEARAGDVAGASPS